MTDSIGPQVGALVRLSARIAAAGEQDVRAACAECIEADVPTVWVEEAILQSYLFAGFPRTLNAMREWRRISGTDAPPAAPASDRVLASSPSDTASDLDAWRAAGEATCGIVYGKFYEKLRHNIALLHPALDEWMIVEGYGKILSRPGLELRLREYCVVAACVAAGQDRQLHSHLHGALNAGSTAEALGDVIEALSAVVDRDNLRRATLLLARVLGK